MYSFPDSNLHYFPQVKFPKMSNIRQILVLNCMKSLIKNRISNAFKLIEVNFNHYLSKIHEQMAGLVARLKI